MFWLSDFILEIKFLYIIFLICFLQIYAILFLEFMWIVTFRKIIWNSIVFIEKISKNSLKMVLNVFIFWIFFIILSIKMSYFVHKNVLFSRNNCKMYMFFYYKLLINVCYFVKFLKTHLKIEIKYILRQR